jgi:hypothetical protein
MLFLTVSHAGITSQTVSLVMPNNEAVFVTDSAAQGEQIIIGQAPQFPVLLQGLSFITNTNALIRTLQIASKRKNSQCCQVWPTQIYSIPQFLTLFHNFPTPVHEAARDYDKFTCIVKWFESIISIIIIIFFYLFLYIHLFLYLIYIFF